MLLTRAFSITPLRVFLQTTSLSTDVVANDDDSQNEVCKLQICLPLLNEIAESYYIHLSCSQGIGVACGLHS